VLILLTLVGLACLGGAYLWLQASLGPVSQQEEPTEAFVIRKGQGASSIGAGLKEAGLIKSPLAFKIAVFRMEEGKVIQAGSFRLSPSMTVHEIIEELTHGTTDVWVTLLEGWRREEIAAAIEAAFVGQGADFDGESFLQLTAGKEGRLFPDTYLFPLDASEETVASILENTFQKKLTDKMKADIQKSGRTLNQVLTMASLIEREAREEEARKIVSGILWKRIENDWPLQVDATLQYALGYDASQKTWWTPPTSTQKQIDSPYNTYAHPGLPPGPIASPSFSSLMAAIYPIATDHWFYLTDNQGRMHYAETLEQHNQNINQYLR
jgi:UPF0755 protein